MGIQQLRDNSTGLVTKIIVGLIIVVFALFGMGSITTFLAPVAKVATVNGDNVTQQEMEIAVQRNRRILIAQNVEPQNIDEDELRENVLQSLINRKLLSQESEALSLEYSDSALDEEIRATEVFQIDGQFNPQQFQLVIGSAGFSPVTYREEMRRDKEFQQINSAIAGSSFLTTKEAERARSLVQQTRDIAFLQLDVKNLLDAVIVDENEVQDYYDANSFEFVTEETIDIEYLELKRSDLIAQMTVDESELVLFYEDAKELYAKDEMHRVAHILIEISDETSEEAAKIKVDEIYATIIDGGDFSELAKDHSDDPGSAENGGDLGLNESGTFVDEFEAVSYELALNEVSEPVLTEFGFHIIKLLGIEEAKTPELSEIRDRIERDFRESLAEDIFVSKSARLDEMAFESQDLLDPSEELDLEIQTTGHVNRATSSGIAANGNVIAAAFGPDVLVDGNNSSVIEINANHHVVVRIREHKPSEIQPFADVSSTIREQLQLDKAGDLAESQAEEMVAMLESGSITRYVADQYGLEWQVTGEASRSQIGMDPTINRLAFSLPKPLHGDKSVGYTMLPGGGAAVISVTNVKIKAEGPAGSREVEALGRALALGQGNVDYQEYQASLLKAASVTRTN